MSIHTGSRHESPGGTYKTHLKNKQLNGTMLELLRNFMVEGPRVRWPQLTQIMTCILPLGEMLG